MTGGSTLRPCPGRGRGEEYQAYFVFFAAGLAAFFVAFFAAFATTFFAIVFPPFGRFVLRYSEMHEACHKAIAPPSVGSLVLNAYACSYLAAGDMGALRRTGPVICEDSRQRSIVYWASDREETP